MMQWEPAVPVEIRGVLSLPRTEIPEDAVSFCAAVTSRLERSALHPLGSVDGCLVPALTLYTPSLENHQLRCAREAVQTALNGVAYTERSCVYDDECVAMSLDGGPGKPLMESLRPSDYTQTLETGTGADGERLGSGKPFGWCHFFYIHV